MAEYANIIVDIFNEKLDKTFQYRIPEEMKEKLTLGMQVYVPFGKRNIKGYVVELTDEPEFEVAKIKEIIGIVTDSVPIESQLIALAGWMKKNYGATMNHALKTVIPIKKKSNAVEHKSVRLKLTEIEAKSELAEFERKHQKARVRLLSALIENPQMDQSMITQKLNVSGAVIRALETVGIVEVVSERSYRNPVSHLDSKGYHLTLNEEQQSVVDVIERNLDQNIAKTYLIKGVTGSGKTEVYLTLIADALAQGRTAIFLVPEISLTPQMLSQLRARFGSAAAILHSGLSAGERFDEWQRLREGSARIAIGARSAVFAPVENIGIIVLDEEHDGSYSSESAPRYNTFDIALMRARHNGCKLVLGSATPSVETYKRALDGEFALVRMPDRINARPLPDVNIVDMRREVKRGNPSPFSAALRERLESCLAEGQQAILFLNRRGYSQTVLCRDCGYVAKCEQCDVSLTYHSEENCLKCHYCGARYRMLEACPSCGGKHIYYAGTGTQRVVGELKKLYPSARMLRMDNDTTNGKEGHYRILKQFADREADILVGTQMVAKGHDFPLVTLVGILDADMSLHFPDYRSGERTFQLVTQVAGRSGRGKEKGDVVLQTYDPDNYILRFAAAYDYEGFYRHEVNMRAATMFPPFAVIVRVMVSGAEDRAAVGALREVYEKLQAVFVEEREEFLFFNRMHAPIKRIQGKFRYQVLMRLTSRRLLERIYEIVSGVKHKDTLVWVEENPSNLS